MVTPYFLNLVAGNVMHSASVSALPSVYYVALSTTVPDSSGGNFTEVSGNGYTRGAFGTASSPSNGLVSNLADVEYPEATGSWGTLKAFGLYDAATGGNLLTWNTLTPNQSVVSGNQVRFKPGALQITFKAETT